MPVTNERQYRIARRRAADFASAIEKFEAKSHERPDTHPRLLRAELEAMKSQLADLRGELEEYERSKASDPSATAATVPAARRELGFLDGELAIGSDDDFEMTEEEFLGGP